jgi:hypothetical protein
MKKLLYILLAFMVVSCDSFLDETTTGNLIPENVDHLGDMILTAPEAYDNGMFSGFTTQTFLNDDLIVLEASFSASAKKAYLAKDVVFEGLQRDNGYISANKKIQISNHVLAEIDNAPEGSAKRYTREVIKASARFMRAVAHFDIVNLYAPHYNPSGDALGYPIIESPSWDQTYKRETVSKVYEFVVAQLEESLVDLPDFINCYEPSKASVYAYLARIYLFMGEYDNCVQSIENLFELKNELEDYNTLPPGPYSRDYARNPSLNKDFIMFNGGGLRGSFGAMFTKEVNEMWNVASDCRVEKLLMQDANGFALGWSNNASTGVTLGEMYVTYAEALLRKQGSTSDDKEKAVNALITFLPNRYKTAPVVDPNISAADLLDFVMEERRREMFTTGFRTYDLKRLNALHNANISITHTLGDESVTFEPNDSNWQLAFPQTAKFEE